MVEGVLFLRMMDSDLDEVELILSCDKVGLVLG